MTVPGVILSKAWLIGMLTITYLSGQAVPVCSAVTETDARSILGPSARRTKDPSACGWEDASRKKQMNVARVGIPAMFEPARSSSAMRGSTKVENDLGGVAFSTIPTSDRGGRAAIYLVTNQAMLIVDIEGFGPGGAEQHLQQVRDLVRKLIFKL